MKRVLYRFIESRYFDAFMHDGSIRISSLTNYRNHDGELIGDPLDGSTISSGFMREVKPGELEQYPQLKGIIAVGLKGEDGWIPGTGGSNMTITGFRRGCGEMFVCCCAYRYCPDMHLRWLSNENKDLCFRISDARAFAFEVGKILNQRFRIGMPRIQQVIYANYSKDKHLRLDHPAHKHPPEIVKQWKYRRQLEMRIMWEPINTRITLPDFIDIKVPEARKYCEAFQHLKRR